MSRKLAFFTVILIITGFVWPKVGHSFGSISVAVTPSSFNAGEVNQIILSGDFYGSTISGLCQSPLGKPFAYAEYIQSVSYKIKDASGNPVGPVTGISNFYQLQSGISFTCSDTQNNYSQYKYRFGDGSGGNLPTINVTGLGPGSYQIFFDTAENTSETCQSTCSYPKTTDQAGPTFTINQAPTGTVCINSNVSSSGTISEPVTPWSTSWAGTTACYPGVPTGSYTAYGVPLGGYTGPVYNANPQTLTANQTITFNLTYTTVGGGGPPSCAPATQSVQTNVSAGLSASGGNGTFSWSASGGSPASGAGSSFSTSYASTGTKTVTVTSNGQSANCSVEVTTPPPGSCTINSFTADSTTLDYPANSTTLRWSTTNASTLTGSNAWSGGKTIPDSSQGTGALSVGAHTFTLSCTAGGGNDSKSVTVNVNPQGLVPTCTGGGPQTPVTSATSGGFYVYAYGVRNATSVNFYTWSDVNGQDDIVVYPGTNIGVDTVNGGFIWRATVDLGAHRSGNPDYGQFNSHIYLANATASPFCSTANFVRDRGPIGNLDAANCSVIGGWAFDPDTTSDPIGIHMYKDGPAGSGTFVDAVTTTGLRQDVNNAYGITGNHGFGWYAPLPNSLLDGGTHSVYLYGINTNPAGNNSLIGQSTVSGCYQAPTATLSASPNPVDYNTASTLIWSSTQTVVNSCSIPGLVTGGATSGSVSTGNLITDTSYTVTCQGLNGSPVSSSVTVDVGAPPVPEAAIRCNGLATSCDVAYNSSVPIQWCGTDNHNCANSSSCSVAFPGGSWTGLKGPQQTANLITSADYTLTCTGTGGTSTSTVRVNVGPPPTPTATISASPIPVPYNGSTTITWSSENTTSCSITQNDGPTGWGSATSDSRTASSLISNYTFKATCTGPGGTATAEVNVVVTSPSCNIKANGSDGPITLAYGSNVTLSWGSTNSATAIASGDWSGSKATGGSSEQTGALIVPKTYNYTLACTGNGSVSDTVQVVISAPVPTASSVTYSTPDYCTTGPGGFIVWTYSDPANSTQTAYQIQIDDQGSFQDPEYDSNKIISSSKVFAIPNGVLEFNKGYKARVRVWNSYDAPSAWSSPTGTFNTPNYAYPQVRPPYEFTWPTSPKPQQNKPLQFTDRTVFGGGNVNNRQWSWNFGDGGTSNQQNPAHTYVATGTYTVTETVTDAANQSCTYSQSVNVIKPIPIIKEVAPR